MKKKKPIFNLDKANQMFRMAGYFKGEDGEVSNYLPPKVVDHIDQIEAIIAASSDAAKGKGEPFTVEVKKKKIFKYNEEKGVHEPQKDFTPITADQCSLRYAEEGRNILYVLRFLPDLNFVQLLEQLDLSPEIKRFLRHAKESGIIDVVQADQVSRKLHAKEMAKALNGFVQGIRSEAHTPEFKQAVNSNRRRVNKNRQSIEELLDSIFARHSRVLAIRLDCAYHRPEGLGINEFARHITEEKAKADLDKFLKRNAPHGLYKHLLGYVVKMEMGPQKGIHFHVLMIFDGRYHREDITIATVLGKYWEEITDGQGLAFNCNLKWQGKPHCAVGMIHRDNKEMREALKERVVTYMTKADEYFQFLPKLSHRTLFRSQIKGLRQAGQNDKGTGQGEAA